jgi:hypothetical protein
MGSWLQAQCCVQPGNGVGAVMMFLVQSHPVRLRGGRLDDGDQLPPPCGPWIGSPFEFAGQPPPELRGVVAAERRCVVMSGSARETTCASRCGQLPWSNPGVMSCENQFALRRTVSRKSGSAANSVGSSQASTSGGVGSGGKSGVPTRRI